jgi:CRISPR-associated protein Csx10
VIVTLLSDFIGRGRSGQVDADFPAAVQAALGLAAPPQPARGYSAMRVAGGYNRKWRLPLPQAWVVAAGSVFVFAAAAVDAAKLRQAAAMGLGERTAEGFGRIAVGWQYQPRLTAQKLEAPAPAGSALSPASARIAERMARRLLRQELERGLAARVAAIEVKNPPPNAQLSRVRSAALRALGWDRPPLQPVLELIGDLKKDAQGKYAGARVDGKTLLTWLRERAEDCDVQAQLLDQTPNPTVAGQAAALDDQLRVEYTARLLDGVMRKAAKQNQEKEAGR